MADCTGLENRQGLIPFVGSNPTASAKFKNPPGRLQMRQSALDCKSRASGFLGSNPSRPTIILRQVFSARYVISMRVAQLVERRSPKPQVGGSIPSAHATFFRPLAQW